MKSLQEQYLLVKEGKISKEHFLKQARTIFPNYINQYTTFNNTVNILKGKDILHESVGVVVTKGAHKDWFSIFNKNIKEAKAVEKNPTKEVTDMETRGYDYENKDNIDNIYGNQFLKGYYTEMKDPKNAKKTVDELKSIVAKNLAKDFSYYTKNGMYGTKGVGYTDEAPALGKNTQPKSKNASVLGGHDEVNSESDVVKNSLVGQTKFTKKSLKESINEEVDALSMNESGLREAVRSLVKQAIKERTQQEIDAEKKGISDEIKSKEDQKKGLDASINALKARQGQIGAEKATDTTGA